MIDITSDTGNYPIMSKNELPPIAFVYEEITAANSSKKVVYNSVNDLLNEKIECAKISQWGHGRVSPYEILVSYLVLFSKDSRLINIKQRGEKLSWTLKAAKIKKTRLTLSIIPSTADIPCGPSHNPTYIATMCLTVRPNGKGHYPQFKYYVRIPIPALSYLLNIEDDFGIVNDQLTPFSKDQGMSVVYSTLFFELFMMLKDTPSFYQYVGMFKELYVTLFHTMVTSYDFGKTNSLGLQSDVLIDDRPFVNDIGGLAILGGYYGLGIIGDYYFKHSYYTSSLPKNYYWVKEPYSTTDSYRPNCDPYGVVLIWRMLEQAFNKNWNIKFINEFCDQENSYFGYRGYEYDALVDYLDTDNHKEVTKELIRDMPFIRYLQVDRPITGKDELFIYFIPDKTACNGNANEIHAVNPFFDGGIQLVMVLYREQTMIEMQAISLEDINVLSSSFGYNEGKGNGLTYYHLVQSLVGKMGPDEMSIIDKIDNNNSHLKQFLERLSDNISSEHAHAITSLPGSGYSDESVQGEYHRYEEKNTERLYATQLHFKRQSMMNIKYYLEPKLGVRCMEERPEMFNRIGHIYFNTPAFLDKVTTALRFVTNS